MKHFFYLDQDTGCQVHRGVYPSRYLKRDFPQHTFHTAVGDPEWPYDVYSIHGLPHIKSVEQLGKWKALGKTIVWSIDDNYLTTPPWNPCYLRRDELSSWYLTKEVADVIVVSTPELAKAVGKPDKTVVARNLMDLDYYPQINPADETEKLVVYWGGSRTHSRDLEIVKDAVTEILKKYRSRVEFIFFGYVHPETARDHLHNGVYWQKGVPLSMYPSVLSAIRPHITLAPLDDCDFNWSKSSIRVLEGFALSSAVVASPVGEYKLIRDGVDGIYATTTAEWVSAIERLILDREYARNLAVAGRQRVEEIGDWRNPECRKSAGWWSYVHRLEELTAGNAIAA